MDLVNLMHKYINKFINSDELLKELNNIDLSNYPLDEVEIINKLIMDINDIVKNISNEIDDAEKQRMENLEKILSILKKTIDNENNSEDIREEMRKRYDKLLKDKEIVRDGGKLYDEIFTLLTNNSLICKYTSAMNDKELLDFITQYISVPMPPKINQETFNELVQVGINEDRKEALWRLAFNYKRKKMDFSLIEDYFIKEKDDYYIIELICAVKEDLNMAKLLDKIIESDDKVFIEKVIKYGTDVNVFTDEELEKLKNCL